MDQAERAVAVARPLVAGALDDHAHRREVVDLVELAALLGHLVVDRIEVLRAAGDLDRDVDLVQLELQDARRLRDVSFSVGPTLRHHRLYLLVLARVQRFERKVFELPLERVDAQPVRKRRVDLERLLRLLHLLLLAEVLDLAEVVQAIRELDQDHAHVLGHGDDQLAVVLRLRLLATLELHAGQLGHTFHELRDLVAELGAHVVEVDVGVLDDVVEQRRRDRLVVELQLRADLRRAPGVEDELLAGAALLTLVGVRSEGESPCDQLAVDIRVVGRDVRNQLIDELLMLFVSLKDSHISSVLRVFSAPSLDSGAYLKRRNGRSDEERKLPMAWYRRRQERKATARAARLLVALNACASSRPRTSPAGTRLGLSASARKRLAV